VPRRGDRLETRWTRRPHIKAKHDLLVRYLGAWLPIMGRSMRKAIVLDAFAGPGRYDHGEEGSPILVLNALARALGPGSAKALGEPRTLYGPSYVWAQAPMT
jgi:hypothetical protein